MKNELLYNKTVNILVQAYFNDTLEHGYCTCCAVGNIVAANMGYCISKDRQSWIDILYPGWHGWGTVFITSLGIQRIDVKSYNGEPKNQIDSTGYTLFELAKIEKAFESAHKGTCDEDWMFNGLMAVIDVLDEIHENKDAAITSQTKELFIKA